MCGFLKDAACGTGWTWWIRFVMVKNTFTMHGPGLNPAGRHTGIRRENPGCIKKNRLVSPS
jgi:hypothetical protein